MVTSCGSCVRLLGSSLGARLEEAEFLQCVTLNFRFSEVCLVSFLLRWPSFGRELQTLLLKVLLEALVHFVFSFELAVNGDVL